MPMKEVPVDESNIFLTREGDLSLYLVSQQLGS